MDLKGKRLVIAGASRGIGAAAVQQFAQAGASLAIGARSAQALAHLAATCPAVRYAAPCDFTDAAAVTGWLAGAQSALGGIDGLLITLTAGRAASSEADLDASYATDFKAPVLLLRACLPMLIATAGAALLCSSRTAQSATPQTLAYGSAKAALEYAARCLAAETCGHGVRVNAIALGSTLTADGFWAGERNGDTALWHSTLRGMPQGRLASAADVLAPMQFLLSDAARWITGQTLLVDGGQTLTAP